ncbi:hypothetical protein [Pseudochrobactrum saccharolyticum]|uniref:Uncharacterized protein n=1 Tax=Pseudochrobactrum saccharolyticum TaxID=354352 RepID=A0A7W8AHZ1_9HYPH|nr:hypothetical protein [Pseudochrobactrum saccharolyticum]KAB0540965.1 hypothetical protein F7P81_06440 [Pseudochrobactrum saccharolyticum]MBB5090575.1 hypothetical protein [Pseudochrobactrum saccharolyticum]MDP8252476.1 hypothetical protein [Pseudochrobactrum saccharolyticum]
MAFLSSPPKQAAYLLQDKHKKLQENDKDMRLKQKCRRFRDNSLKLMTAPCFDSFICAQNILLAGLKIESLQGFMHLKTVLPDISGHPAVRKMPVFRAYGIIHKTV